jgi:hypothetical protein
VRWDVDGTNGPGAGPAVCGPTVSRLPLTWEVVAQTIAGLDFLCVCDKVRIRGRAFSVAEDPLWPTEPLSRGHRKRPLSNSYKGCGLCDALLGCGSGAATLD